MTAAHCWKMEVIMKLLNGIWQVGGPGLTHFFDATVYLLEGKDEYILIDCGTPE